MIFTSARSGYILIHTSYANETTYLDTGLEANTTYYYKVRAVNEAGGSSYTAETNATPSNNGGGTIGGSMVTWTDLVGVTVETDNTLKKTAGYGADNGGAASEEILPTGRWKFWKLRSTG